MKELVKVEQLSLKLFGDKFQLYPNGLIIYGQPSEEEYDEAFRRLRTIEDATAWWYGDLALGREKHYGSLKELADRLEINYNTLAQQQYVSSRYQLCDRSQSWKHHLIAAPLEDRLEWLQKAVNIMVIVCF